MGGVSGWTMNNHRVCYACGYRVPENEFYIDHWRTNCVNTLLRTEVVLAWQGGP